MLQDIIHPPQSKQLQIGGLMSPISDPILDFCEDADLFPMTSNLSSGAFASDASKFDPAALSVLLDPPQPEPDYRFLIDPPQPFDLPLMSTAEFSDPALSCSFLDPGGIGVVGASDYVAAPEMVGFQADNCGGLYGMDSMQGVFSTTEMQEALSEKQMRGFGSPSPVTVNSSVGSFDDSTFKVGRLSVEEKKERINRYLKKRNERNFHKKIKYACRKTLADSRPRVRGRFAKNDEFGEATRPGCGNHEDYDDDEVVIKEEEDILNSDIFAHINGVNSFKCNYGLESWI